MWGGGDPIYKDPKRGGNIADLAHALLKANHIKDVAAVQRIGHTHTPHQHFAFINNKL